MIRQVRGPKSCSFVEVSRYAPPDEMRVMAREAGFTEVLASADWVYADPFEEASRFIYTLRKS